MGIQGGVGGPTWQQSPKFELPVASTRGFVQYTLVKVGGRALCAAVDRHVSGMRAVRRVVALSVFTLQNSAL